MWILIAGYTVSAAAFYAVLNRKADQLHEFDTQSTAAAPQNVPEPLTAEIIQLFHSQEGDDLQKAA